MKRFTALVLLSCIGAAQATEPDAATQAVLDCTSKNVPEKSFRQASKMTVTDSAGQIREMRATFAGMRGKKGIMLNVAIDAPQDIAGTTVLLRRDDDGQENIKIYLPALRRVRNVSGGMESQGIFGTDFSYRDLKDIFGAVRDGSVKLLSTEDDAVHRLQINPDAATSPYQTIIAEIDKTHCVPQQLSFETKGQGIVKTLTGDPETLYLDSERAMLLDYTMVDAISGSSTRLELGKPELDERISRLAFNPGNFHNYQNRIDKPQ